MAALNIKVDSLTLANATVTTEKVAVTDTMLGLRKQENTVFVVVGTKDELMKKGIIAEEGSKFLFFGSKAMVPRAQAGPVAVHRRSTSGTMCRWCCISRTSRTRSCRARIRR